MIERIAETVKKMNPKEIEIMMDEVQKDSMVNAEARKKAVNICYDRYVCSMLGIDYNRINDEDFARAVVASYLISRGDNV